MESRGSLGIRWVATYKIRIHFNLLYLATRTLDLMGELLVCVVMPLHVPLLKNAPKLSVIGLHARCVCLVLSDRS